MNKIFDVNEAKSRALTKVDVELFSDRIAKVAKEIKSDNYKIANLAAEYNEKYKDEIAKGTAQMDNLLTEGIKEGLTTEEVTVKNGFIPTIHTPVTNWLYFFMGEHDDDPIIGKKKEMERKNLNKKHGYRTYGEEEGGKSVEATPDIFEYMYGNVTSKVFDKLKKLKALSQSENENEAFVAYRAGIKLCKEYDLDFDKVPSPRKK